MTQAELTASRADGFAMLPPIIGYTVIGRDRVGPASEPTEHPQIRVQRVCGPSKDELCETIDRVYRLDGCHDIQVTTIYGGDGN